MPNLFDTLLTILENAGVEVIDDTPVLLSFDMRDDYFYLDVCDRRVCVGKDGSVELFAEPNSAWPDPE